MGHPLEDVEVGIAHCEGQSQTAERDRVLLQSASALRVEVNSGFSRGVVRGGDLGDILLGVVRGDKLGDILLGCSPRRCRSLEVNVS